MMPRALIFDLDGVIADTIPAHLRAWMAVLAECGVTLTPDDFQRRFNGQMNTVIIRETLGSDVSDDEIARISEDKERRYRALTQSHLHPLPGLPEFVAELVAKQVPRAIATAAPPENVAHVLAAVGLRDAFPIVVDSSMVTRGKPAPDLFLRAAEKLGVAPTDCVVFEDSLNGVEAARQADMRVVGLTTTHTPDELLRADRVIDDFLQLSLSDLASLGEPSAR